ncbi:MAG TPA: hypothetical protein VE619_02810 [Nitrososphaeraceae archaeon]|nr:hypothetical protein [Nitrososphaeraceae archaeon]
MLGEALKDSIEATESNKLKTTPEKFAASVPNDYIIIASMFPELLMLTSEINRWLMYKHIH